MLKIAKKLLMMLIISVFMIFVVAATVHAGNTLAEENEVEYKEKKIKSYKIKWDANGGKIGTKKTVTSTVKNGANIKLAKTPKMTGYTFEGWYTKKSGGSKITKNIKVKKSITYYAQWKKKINPRTLNGEEKKLVGRYSTGGSLSGGFYSYYDSVHDKWNAGSFSGSAIEFKSDGTYNRMFVGYATYAYRGGMFMTETGKWRVSSKGTVHTTNIVQNTDYKDGTKLRNQKMMDASYKYAFTEKYGKNGIELTYKTFSPDFYERIK